MGISSKPSLLFSSCSLLMAALFAYSASVQLNDPDWYFWFSLYTFATLVNLLKSCRRSRTSDILAPVSLLGAIILFVKVVVEAFADDLLEVFSLDMEKKVVREKLGSGFVIVSMFLHVNASCKPVKNKREKVGRSIDLGMLLLVVISYGLSLGFFLLVKEI
ncbi:transmembrane protein 220 isoform X1 [Amborella trichopoda]|uniref:Transmembrane protein n=2 Tax=Amborella trichopoda TaxID=13333 RepID=W1P9M5_AMBTC|nr:transmembrane protein 220 isoform X1 [Amborella trichopoda]ERN04389.1 hypothetical protein AMTR_s00147p00097680 [Amborella trichopoda]|eukprot:XP_006842714.1 transmembrane protein 220 isoform X1 [Amborella trichopoda]